MQEPSSFDPASVITAAVASVLLHVLLYLVLPNDFRAVLAIPVSTTPVRPLKVTIAPAEVSPERLPEHMRPRVIEAPANANRAVPEKTPFVAARNQTAAQPVPEKKPTQSSLPRTEGTSQEMRVSQGVPRRIQESSVVQAETQPGTSAIAIGMAPGNRPGPVGAGGQAPQAKPNPVPVPQPAAADVPKPVNPERPKAMVPSGTAGLLLRNNVGVNRAGLVAVDARFSQYGDYVQRMMEAIQSSWWDIIERSRFETVATGSCVVRFVLRRDGTVRDAQILRTDVPRMMALACKDAVMAPAPYDAWRADMVALYGEEDVVTISFHYR